MIQMISQRAAATGIKLLAFFFVFGAVMCTLTIVTPTYPGSVLEPLWRVNPEARTAFTNMGPSAFVLMIVLGTACPLTAIGLFTTAEWARRLAGAVLVVNLLGDALGAMIRNDPRTLIGIPIAAAMVWFLLSRTVRQIFETKAALNAQDDVE